MDNRCHKYSSFIQKCLEGVCSMLEGLQKIAPAIEVLARDMALELPSIAHQVKHSEFIAAKSALSLLLLKNAALKNYQTTDPMIRSICTNVFKVLQTIQQNGLDYMIKNCDVVGAPVESNRCDILAQAMGDLALYVENAQYSPTEAIPLPEETLAQKQIKKFDDMFLYELLSWARANLSESDNGPYELAAIIVKLWDFFHKQVHIPLYGNESRNEVSNEYTHERCIYCLLGMLHCNKSQSMDHSCYNTECAGNYSFRELSEFAEVRSVTDTKRYWIPVIVKYYRRMLISQVEAQYGADFITPLIYEPLEP